jgi:DNA-directed RNA polymerase specialized sigma24 family protein
VAQTARALGKRPGTVRVASHRALRRLADLLAAAGSEHRDVTLRSRGSVRR